LHLVDAVKYFGTSLIGKYRDILENMIKNIRFFLDIFSIFYIFYIYQATSRATADKARHQRSLKPHRVLLLTTTGNRFQDVVLLVLATRHQSPLEPHHVLLTVS